MSDEPPNDPFSANGPAMRRPRRRVAEFTWFALLWLAGVAAVGAVALVVRGVLS